MKLKTYQKEVLADLKNFLKHLAATDNLRNAFRQHWLDRSIDPHTKNNDLLHPYNNTVAPQVPNVTLKVPTAGGKTYIAANALEHIFDYLPEDHPKVVAWFVPSDSIREQTLKSLQTLGHPYNDALRGLTPNVLVEGKEEALQGTQLTPMDVENQLTVLVLSAQSFASKTGDDLRSWRQNAVFAKWEGRYHYSTEQRIEGADELSLIQWLAWQRPVCVVDESHNFGSDMRTEMLRLLNPSFILNLTATPKAESNIVSFVDAGKLKKESMVKLPVVLYNMDNSTDVLINAIRLQKSLERHAEQVRKKDGRYIRPIVLLQVEPRTGKEDANYKLVRQTLLDAGIPEEQVKLKLADPYNELKGVDLMSTDCPVRYIITVNALKEGWDCPFAYVLAALSNRTSPIDVEQVLGRILRQPDARKTSDPLLNESYVLTAKQDFYAAAEAIIRSLQRSGYSRRDYRLAKHEPEKKNEPEKPSEPVATGKQTSLWEEPGGELKLDPTKVAEAASVLSDEDGELEQKGYDAEAQYREETEKNPQTDITPMTNTYAMRNDVSEVAQQIHIPLFSIENKTINDFCAEPHILLTKEKLNSGFELLKQDLNIALEDSQTSVTSIDLKDSGDGQYTPKRTLVNDGVLSSLRQTFASFSPEMKRSELTKIIVEKLHYNSIPHQELSEYVQRALSSYNGEQLSDFYLSSKKTAQKFKDKIDDLLEVYRSKLLEKWLQARIVGMNCYWNFPLAQNVASKWDSVDKSLYVAEEHASPFEEQIMERIAAEPNVLFWHRNTQSRKDTFYINGFMRHEPDFIVVLDTNDVLLIEKKGEHLLNEKNKRKIKLGRMWTEYANRQDGKFHFHYYMMFLQEHDAEGAVSEAGLIEQIRLFRQR